MQKMVLTDSWLIGHRQIDQEHNELADLINELIGCLKDTDLSLFERVASLFYDKLKNHFENETMIMNTLGYSDTNHAKAHSLILGEIKESGANINEENMQNRLHIFIDVFVNKVLKDDLYFAEYLVNIKYKDSPCKV